MPIIPMEFMSMLDMSIPECECDVEEGIMLPEVIVAMPDIPLMSDMAVDVAISIDIDISSERPGSGDWIVNYGRRSDFWTAVVVSLQESRQAVDIKSKSFRCRCNEGNVEQNER